MRISDCAELTGTTVRTIRYYHQIGILPVPETRMGRRDYGLDHAARILRIRWLADAGISLDTITGILSEDPHEPDDRARTLRELTVTASALDERITELTEQRERIAALMTMTEEGREFSPLPPSFALFYERVAERLDDPDALEALEKERRIGEMFAQRGLLSAPSSLNAVMEKLTDEDVDRVVEFYTSYVQIPRLPADEADVLAGELRQLINQWVQENPQLTTDTLALLPEWSTSAVGMRILQGFMTLVANDARQARLLRGILHDLLTPSPNGSPS